MSPLVLSLSRMTLPIRAEHALPIVLRAQVRRVHEHVERLAAGRRDARVGRGRRRDVARRVGRGLALRGRSRRTPRADRAENTKL